MTIARCFLFVWFFLPLYSYWLFPFALPQLQSRGGSNKSFHFKFWGSGLKAADSPVLLLRITVINLTVVSTVQNPPRAFKPWDLPLGVYKSSTTANSWLPDPKWGAVTPRFIHGKSEMLQNSSTLFALKTLPHTHTLSGNCLALVNSNQETLTACFSSGTRGLEWLRTEVIQRCSSILVKSVVSQ